MDDAALPTKTPDPRDPDYSRKGIFIYHDCYRCEHGKQKCCDGGTHVCRYLRARND